FGRKITHSMRNSMILKQGDKIGLVATARWIEQETVDIAMAQISEWGFIPVVGKHALSKNGQLAGTDKARASDLQMMLDDNTIKAIFCLRGGYGTIRIIDRLDFTLFTQFPKWICGFSDITILHAHINDKLGLPTLHCSMPYSFPTNTSDAIAQINAILKSESITISSEATSYNKIGEASGILVGGNLSILYSLLGTRYGFSTAGKILFIEDLDEYKYHIDRMMMSMKLAGKLDHIKGLIVGGMSDMKDNPVPFGMEIEEIILEHVAHLNIPVCFNFPAGHIEHNLPIRLGTQAALSVTTSGGKLSFL
ncbi:MAG TPA: LD-carboxypeptidase, partial [Chitinophagales bacterium]|nr:LD-carboxypeptidase [Chitinophagales bacterium]